MSPEPERRVGILGGSFDPPHLGHLWMARRARQAAGLDEVLLIPAYRPPHKSSSGQSPFDARMAMTSLLASSEPWLRVSDIEQRLGGISYSVETVAALRREQEVETDWFLIMGEDSLEEIETWKDPDSLFSMARVLVLAREGSSAPDGRAAMIIAGQTHPAQSRVIRAELRAGRLPSDLSDEVLDYIRAEGLYCQEGDAPSSS